MDKLNCSVLIVDDNPEDRYIMERMVKKVFIPSNIYEAINGQEALPYLSKLDKDHKLIIFLDINMPVMNGFEFLDTILKTDIIDISPKQVLIAMYSTSQDYDEKKKALAHPFVVNYFEKMPTLKQIEGFLQSVVE